MAALDTFLGLDLGTSSVKGVLVAADDGEVIARSERSLHLAEPEPLAAEQDPHDWWNACAAVLLDLAVAARSLSARPLALGLTGQKHALLPLDAEGRPLARAVLWCDGRAHPECVEIHAKVGRSALGRRTGSLAFPGYLLPKWLRLRRLAPDVAARTARLVGAKDWIRLRLTGVAATDRTEASSTLLYDIGKKAWAPDLFAAFDMAPSLLPPVVRSSDVAGTLTAEAARETGLPLGLPVVGGAGDNEAGALGCGAVSEGRVAVILGTSGTVVAYHATRGSAGGVVWGRHALRRGYGATGVVLSAGRALEWVRRAAFPSDFTTEEVLEAAAASDPAEGALVFVPSLVGERSPVPDPGASGAFVGLRPGHGRGHLARAVIEGVSIAIADTVRAMRGAGVAVSELRVTSGGARSPFWRASIAAAADLPVVAMGDAEGPSVGAAMLAARSTGSHGTNLVSIAERWARPPAAEAPVPAEVARMGGLAVMHAAARSALRAVGAPPAASARPPAS
ncbi:MAG: xylulokinase [Planctomycetes bacterium]|nr:xylulokinase [Planctomycetota bacterium]